MTDDADTDTIEQLPVAHHAPDAFAVLADLLTALANPREAKRRMAELQRETKRLEAARAAVADAQAKLAEYRAELDTVRAKYLAEYEREKDALYQVQLDTIQKESALNDRHAVICALEQKWRFAGESEAVQSGFQSPELDPAEKARRFYGVDQEASGATQPLPVTEPAEDLVGGSLLTRTGSPNDVRASP
jgi:hypothetical protein